MHKRLLSFYAHYHRHLKLYHLMMFASVAVVMTLVGESGIAMVSFAGFLRTSFRLFGEILADIIFRRGFFGE